MSVNDYCRFCKVNLRSQEIISGTRLIFQEKATGKNGVLHSQCLKFGLILQNTPLRSNRACSKCYRIIARMARNMDCLNGWRKRESKKICEGEGANTNDRRHSVPTSFNSPSSSESSMEKPSQSSMAEGFINGGSMTDHSSPFLSVEIPDQTKGHQGDSQKPPSNSKMADSLLLLECDEEELEPWQQQTDHQHQEMTIRTEKKAIPRLPAVRPVHIAPLSAPAPAPVASTHMILSGQTLSGNSNTSNSITVPLLTNTLTGLPAVVSPSSVPASIPVASTHTIPLAIPRLPAVRPVCIAPLSAPAPAPVASTHMILSGQTPSGNSSNSNGITVPLLTNTLTGLPAVVTPAPVPAPVPVVLTSQTPSGKDTRMPLLTNTLHLPNPMASVPVTVLPPGFVLVVQQLPFASK